MTKTLLTLLTAALMAGSAALAKGSDEDWNSPNRDPYGYYSQYDKDGFYDREGHYVRFKDQRRTQADDDDTAAPPPPAQVYSEGRYEEQCRKGNNVAGTLFGALAGGLIGGAASSGPHHGADAGAVVGGAILGGLLGNALTRDMPCEDHPHAMRVYTDGLNGDIGRRYEWRYHDDYGDFTAVREYRRRGSVCRDFRETTYINGRTFTREGVACRMRDGYWHFD